MAPRRLLNLPKFNSASEMFVNLNIPFFSELLRNLVLRPELKLTTH